MIFDNYLSQDYFNSIIPLLDNIPWYFGPAVDDDEILCDPLDAYHFVHPIYDRYVQTPTYDLFRDFFKKLNMQTLYSAKINLTQRTDRIIKHGFHTDMEMGGLTAIFYLNTNNGYTEFENGDRVESVANRLIIFDQILKHTGTTTTDTEKRVVLNVNYRTA